MKKTFLIVIAILVLILILPAINLVRWYLQPKKPLGIIMVDKTVPTVDRPYHKLFSWVVTNSRYVKKDSRKSYSISKDYYGFIPKRPLREKQWDKNEYRLGDLIKLAENNDVVYFADTYGVFFNDWWTGLNKSRKSRKLYGGLNNNDYLLLKEMKDKNRLVIMEYNCFDYPTPQFESVRTQEKLGIVSSGWSGKYFSTLDTTEKNFPVWMTSMYRKQYMKPWKFTRPGVVILNEKDIIVLEDGIQVSDPMVYINTEQNWSDKFGVIGKVAFDKWFDIIDPMDDEVISTFSVATTPAGDSLLAQKGIPSHFPAVVRDKPTGKVYYFAGDFATGTIPYWSSMFPGVAKFKGMFYSEKADDPRRFFWHYYKPLMNSLLNECYTSAGK